MSDKFKAGETAYTISGAEVEIIVFAGGKWLAYPIRDTEEGPQYGRSTEYSALYKEPPTDRLNAECDQLTDKKAALAREIHELQAQTHKAQAEHTETMQRLARYKGLEMLEDCVAGRIKWFAVRDVGKVGVQTAEDATAGTDYRGCRDGSIKLVHAKAWDKKVTWSINRHSDGSGCDTRCHPCVERETAVEIASEWLDQIFAEYVDKHAYYIEDAMKSATALGIPIPEAVTSKFNAERLEGIKRNIATKEKELAEQREKLAALHSAV